MNAANLSRADQDTRVDDATSADTLCLVPPTNLLVPALVESGVILNEDWQALPEHIRRSLEQFGTEAELLAKLVEAGLLTPFQAGHIPIHGTRGLVLGNYRLLERIGAGGMGAVYRGEHLLLRRPVAVKVVQAVQGEDDVVLQRFFVEMRALARVRHAHIVSAMDAGAVRSAGHDRHVSYYFVMEYIPGSDLERLVTGGPLSVARACDLIYQVAAALDETHKLGLVHRDIKPSNILVTPEGKAKLLDFGLALHFGRRRLTVPGTLLGTLNYMAPEQVSDAANVDIRADIFGLGGTLFYCLTGVVPYLSAGNVTQQVAARMADDGSPPDLRWHRADVPIELEAIVNRMMAFHRDDRYATPASLMRALVPFLSPAGRPGAPMVTRDAHDRNGMAQNQPIPAADWAKPGPRQILIVDDEPALRSICKRLLRRAEFQCAEAGDGEEALKLLAEREFDVVLLDVDMPRLSGAKTLSRARERQRSRHLKVIMMSGHVSPDEMSTMLALGADDYLAKPLDRTQLRARVESALANKAIQERTDWLRTQLVDVNARLQNTLDTRDAELARVRETLLCTLARLIASRTGASDGHLTRMAEYAKALALAASRRTDLGSAIDEAFIGMLQTCAPLHDIGNIAMPDHILQRTTPLSTEDRMIMQAHTTIGADTLAAVAKSDLAAAPFWKMAIDVCRHHHEQFDGSGYPDRLGGDNIPLPARIVAIADAYDHLRCHGKENLALSHPLAVAMITQEFKGRFDPSLVSDFGEIESDMERIFRTCPDITRRG